MQIQFPLLFIEDEPGWDADVVCCAALGKICVSVYTVEFLSCKCHRQRNVTTFDTILLDKPSGICKHL